MKNHIKSSIFLSLLFLPGINAAFAQAQKATYKYELGIGMPGFPQRKEAWKHISPNISFKYHLSDRNIIRSGLSYYGMNQMMGSGYGFLGNMGYERRFFGPKIQFLAGLDLCFLKEIFEYNDFYAPYQGHKRSFYHIGAGPVLGAVYNFHPRFSLQTELGVYYGFAKDKAPNLTHPYSEGTITSHRVLSLHLYYNFGK